MLESDRISLKGQWWYRQDEGDRGFEQEWYKEAFNKKDKAATIRLPGTLGENGIGEPTVYEAGMTMASVRNFRERYTYRGLCWYQRYIEVPNDWSSEAMLLSLERVLMTSHVWLNDMYIGRRDTLVEPHEYKIEGERVKPGTYRLTVAIDNRDPYHLGEYGHAYTTETQSIWNGIVGRMCLQKVPVVEVQALVIETKPEEKILAIKGNLDGQLTTKPYSYKVSICDEQEAIVAQEEGFIEVSEAGNAFGFSMPIPKDVIWWNAFTPKLYYMRLSLLSRENETIAATQELFGFRRFQVEGRQIRLNGEAIHLRGNLDCCIHPLTGYPPCDREYWEQELIRLQELGMNHVRFHSYCPPEAAFEAADRLGIYLQIEGPVWLDEWFIAFGSYPEHEQFIPKEALRIIQRYGNHPSFCIFCNGNELRGDFQLMHQIIERVKAIRGDLLYTLTANYDRLADSLDDVFISVEADGHGMRGNRFYEAMATRLDTTYVEAVRSRNMPLIAHESGQFAVYPDVREIPLYDGNLMPYNLMIIRDDLIKQELSDHHEAYVTGSLVAAMRLYKEEIESYLRTEDYAGFQLLGVQDFPGQCCATVGVLNSRWEPKPGFEPAWFRQFNQDIVPLVKMEQRVFESLEAIDGTIMVYHYGKQDLCQETLKWALWDGSSCIYEERQSVDVTRGQRHEVAGIKGRHIRQGAPKSYRPSEPRQLELRIEIEGTAYKNSWDLWLFPEIDDNDRVEPVQEEREVLLRTSWNEEVKDRLREGKGVVLVLDIESVDEGVCYKDDFYPVFWSPAFFKDYKSCGFIRKEHPIFDYFPGDSYVNFHWYHLLKESATLQLDAVKEEIVPIIQVIPNFYANHHMTNLFEGRIGKGILLVTTLNMTDKSRPEVQWMEYGIRRYVAQVKEEEVPTIAMESVDKVFEPHEERDTLKDGDKSENFIQ